MKQRRLCRLCHGGEILPRAVDGNLNLLSPENFPKNSSYQNSRHTMHKVKSSPSQSSSPSNHRIYQHLPHPVTLEQPDFARTPIAHGPNPFYTHGGYNRYRYLDESAYGLRSADGTESLPVYLIAPAQVLCECIIWRL
ncbi:hypothetical protein Dsin_008191 [Dipteronia sinensis]|uniref:Uncharacterized protein n=1 Tax=Dipteronia sinensis TaxID=43782 RepID=A0AAE0B300_9ROSI|nr:hypothetical protein Dsin_008191 [Dipteronia sinensis]